MVLKYSSKLKKYASTMRNHSTLPEVLLWQGLKGKQLRGYQFLRQKPIGYYIVDFYCHKLNLVIEVDDSSHKYRWEKDLQRENYLNKQGLKILRFTNKQVKQNRLEVLGVIENYINEFEAKLNSSV